MPLKVNAVVRVWRSNCLARLRCDSLSLCLVLKPPQQFILQDFWMSSFCPSKIKIPIQPATVEIKFFKIFFKMDTMLYGNVGLVLAVCILIPMFQA